MAHNITMTVDRWNELIGLYEQRRLTLADCRSKLKAEIGAAKNILASDDFFMETVTRRLRDKNFRVRLLACESLCLLACPAAVAPLLQSEGRESSREVRQVIRSGLLSFPESCIPEFLRLHSSYLAHEALIHIGRPAVDPICELLARVPAQSNITSLVSILRQIGDPRAGPTLEATYVSHSHTRSDVLSAVMLTGLPHPIPIIRHAMTDSQWLLRFDGVKLAGTLKLSELFSEISVALQDVEAPVRRAAKETLEALKSHANGPVTARAIVPLPEIFIADAGSAVIIDLRQREVSDEMAEMFLLPIRADSVGPFDTYDVQYCRCRPIELKKYHDVYDGYEAVISSYAVPLPSADMIDSLAHKGIPIVVPQEFYIQFDDKKLGGRIARRDAAALVEREPRFESENVPLRKPVLIALPERFDDINGRAAIRIKHRPKPRKRAAMLFEGALSLPSNPTVDENTVPRPYWSFRTAFGGAEWLSAEIESVRRSFLFGRLKLRTKGRHKNEIQIVSPGAGEKGTELRSGLFERHVCAHAFRVEREYRSIFERSGMLSSLFAFSDMPPLPFSFLNSPATIIGISLGLTVAIWNAVGQVWIDLWNAHKADGEEIDGFLAFFSQFQKDRLSVPAKDISITEIVEKAVAGIAGSDFESATALAAGGNARRVLLAVGLGEPDLDGLAKTIERWDAFRQFFMKVSQKRDPEPVDLEPYGEVSTDKRIQAFSDGITQATQFSDVERQAESLIRLLESMGVQFEIDAKSELGSRFWVTTKRKGAMLLLEPCVHFGSQGKVSANGIMMLLHELGHAAIHSRFMGELALMTYCSERIEANRPLAAAHVREIVSSAHRQMIMLHSAVERAADRFALRFLMTPSFIEHLRTAFVEKGGRVQIFALDAAIQMRLGVDSDTYCHRFGPLIWPSLSMGSIATNGALPLTPKILDAMDEASAARLEKLLRDHWARVRRVVEQPEAADVIERSKSPTQLHFKITHPLRRDVAPLVRGLRTQWGDESNQSAFATKHRQPASARLVQT